MSQHTNLIRDTPSLENIRDEYLKYGNVRCLMRYINKETLTDKHCQMHKTRIDGVDEITKLEYNKNLENNIDKLLTRLKNNTYKPLPIKRIFIPKGKGKKTRPLGIPAYEDKLVQGVIADILNVIYEPLFLGCSYGFRPNRNCHKALRNINKIVLNNDVNYIVDADIKSFFDSVNHLKLVSILREIIQDNSFITLIEKFLKCDIMYKFKLIKNDTGTPQGGLISPVLANVYLHYALDCWFKNNIRCKCKMCYLVRYADDFVVFFANETDARSFLVKLVNRFKDFDLELEETKTSILNFNKHNLSNHFNFLGFTISNNIDVDGNYYISLTTIQDRLNAKKVKLKNDIVDLVNDGIPLVDIISKTNKKLVGHYKYYYFNTNQKSVNDFYYYALNILYTVIGTKKRHLLNYTLNKTPLIKPADCIMKSL